ncbi:MAG: hypothetical protein KBE09_03305 [Candidatus Pacebacteria bacterium]|nr:hypothetical protein [Candidatus Paceibacterota bacterium]
MKALMQNSFARYALIIIAFALAADVYMLVSYSQQDTRHAELGYYNTSPMGDAGGRSVPASCPSYPHTSSYGGSCSVSSACGTNYGLYNCDGQCSASAPAVPINYGQPCSTSICGNGAGTIGCNGQCTGGTGFSNAGQPCSSGYNRCGMSNSGSYLCDGSCSASRPSDDLCGETTVDLLTCGDGICSPGETQWSCPADCGAPPRDASACSLTLTPDRILRGTRTVLAWGAQAAAGCTITGVSQETGALIESLSLGSSGSRASAQLTENAYYSMTCTAEDAGGASCTTGQIPIEVVPIPQWNEK